jgi:hypothetical protein
MGSVWSPKCFIVCVTQCFCGILLSIYCVLPPFVLLIAINLPLHLLLEDGVTSQSVVELLRSLAHGATLFSLIYYLFEVLCFNEYGFILKISWLTSNIFLLLVFTL